MNPFKRMEIDYDQYDGNAESGGLWFKGVYPGAHLITPKSKTAYPHFPMLDNYPDHPSREQLKNCCTISVAGALGKGVIVRWVGCAAMLHAAFLPLAHDLILSVVLALMVLIFLLILISLLERKDSLLLLLGLLMLRF